MVLNNLNLKKAPGHDGLPSDICTAAINCDREVFLAIANKCLLLPHFPKQWKVAHVCITNTTSTQTQTQASTSSTLPAPAVPQPPVQTHLLMHTQALTYSSQLSSTNKSPPKKLTTTFSLLTSIHRGICTLITGGTRRGPPSTETAQCDFARIFKDRAAGGQAGIKTHGVALFMSEETERVSIAFSSSASPEKLHISPGIASLLNNDTRATEVR